MTKTNKQMDRETEGMVEQYWSLRQELSQLAEDAQIIGKDLKKRLRVGNVYISDKFKAQKIRIESPAHVVSKCKYDQLLVSRLKEATA